MGNEFIVDIDSNKFRNCAAERGCQEMYLNELKGLLRDVYSKARSEYGKIANQYAENDKRQFHSELSSVWIEMLANSLHKHEIHQHDNVRTDSVKVFFRKNGENRSDFGLNEFLHDICIARTGIVKAAIHNTDLYTVRRVYWQVESELNSSSKEAVKDFNKLVAGSGDNKLFVSPFSGDSRRASDAAQKYRGVLQELLRSVEFGKRENWYLGMVPHPKLWVTTDADQVRCWRFDSETRVWQE